MPENMPEETENPQESPGETMETTNEVSTPEDLEAIKTQLEEEKKAKAAAEAALAEKDARIAELEASLSEANQGSEATAAELAKVTESRNQAVGKYLNMAKALNPALPEGIIAGATVEEIDASVEKAVAIASAVRKTIESEVKGTKVPAGAPPRGEISLEGLTPREKITAGIQQKGGTS